MGHRNDHYQHAENCIRSADPDKQSVASQMAWLAEAQVHATLALTDAIKAKITETEH